MPERNLVMGIDFGSDSARALIVDGDNGDMLGSATTPYRRWADGLYCDPAANRFRQHPADYLESLEETTTRALREAGANAGRHLRGVCVDATGSTPAPVDRNGRPLALLPEFSDNPDAMFSLWKDHTASAEADEINRLAGDWRGEDYLRYQGKYSSEWFWAKILKGIRNDAAVREAAWNWIEECEWLTAELCGMGADFPRSACAAGHKALWHSAFRGLPAREFWTGLDPYLGTVYDRYTAPVASGRAVGTLSEKWRDCWRAGEEVVVSSGLIDAHAGAVGCGVAPGTLVKVIGTSAVDMLVSRADDIAAGDTKTLFGMAENSIVPGLVGIEAGQAAFGDVFRWLERIMSWRGSAAGNTDGAILAMLGESCMDLPPPRVVALDWFNGRRYPEENDLVKACILNLDLGVDAPALYQSLVVGVAFGAKRMLDGFVASGISVDTVVCAGGVARKSPYVIQTLATVLNRDVGVSASVEACALGSAMLAACAAGLHPSLEACQERLVEGMVARYTPDERHKEAYAKAFSEYMAAGRFMEKLSR